MQLEDIVEYWQKQTNTQGHWVHPADAAALHTLQHNFNLDYPVSPYLGDVVGAPVIILNANAGYSAYLTSAEFPSDDAIEAYLRQVREPRSSSWSHISSYYQARNYGSMIHSKTAVVINASPYRSRKISSESENQRAIEKLPSTSFHRQWLQEAVMPRTAAGTRLVIAHRWGLWKIPPNLRDIRNLLFDLKCRAFPDIDSTLLVEAQRFAASAR